MVSTTLTSPVPKHKSDCSTLEQLKSLSNQEFEQIGMSILKWVQDMNWPVASSMASLVVLEQDVMPKHVLAAPKR